MRFLIAFWVAFVLSTGVQAQSFEELTNDVHKASGLMDVYMDHGEAKLMVALPSDGSDAVLARYIYAEYLRAGLGSNPVGLDRSQPGPSYVVAFRRVGSKVFIEVENYQYIATSTNANELRAVADSFASSILWSGNILATDENGHVLVDLTSFLLRDAHGVASQLGAVGQGNYSLQADLSSVSLDDTLVFPDNIELEAFLTFTGNNPGGQIFATTPEPRNITLKVHHSFVRLPDAGYEMRAGDNRSAVIDLTVFDYGADLDEPVVRQVAVRHRLQKRDPSAAMSEPVEPIVYYVDSGAPEPVKSALIEGGSWWNQAFEAAGFINAFQVRELPEGAHPLDARYNIINWVHRQTRGWSYGQSVVDPRTGEIVKGNVLLGSLRVRQDIMIFEGLVGADKTGTGGPNDPMQVALARIRQLSAHEVGHTLGFEHNMAASINDRASVMDYPAPAVGITGNGALDLSQAYDAGIGEWDKVTVQYLYSDFADGVNEKVALDAILDAGYESGLTYVADMHSRPLGAAHPLGNLWDTGSDPVAELSHMLEVRRIALNDFGLDNIRDGVALSSLQQVIVPIYLFHRYQVEAAAKSVGGINFEYATKGDNLEHVSPVDGDRQMQALEVLLSAIAPDALDIPDRVLALMPPAENGFNPQAQREVLDSSAYPSFSLLDAADVAAGLIMDSVLHPQRLSRLAELNARDDSLPSASDVLSRMVGKIFTGEEGESSRHAALRDVVKARFISKLIEVSAGAPLEGPGIPGFSQSRGREVLSASAQAAVEAALAGLVEQLSARNASAFDRMLAGRIAAHLSRPAGFAAATIAGPSTPPGSPIGGTTCWMCDLP